MASSSRQPQEAEDEAYDSSSSDFSSVSTDSLPPIHAYGHTYHGSGRLFYPNDAGEARRLALLHELFSLCLGGRSTDAKLPIEDPEYFTLRADSPPPRYDILDVGSGTGLWAVEVAQKHPQANILGIDLSSALLPKDVPPNLTFEISDAAEPWPPQLYDFIHMRSLADGGIRDWEALISSAYSHLKPGGQLEFVEIHPRWFDLDTKGKGERVVGPAYLEWEINHRRMEEEMGVDLDPVPTVGRWLGENGAEKVRHAVYWCPDRGVGKDWVHRRKGELLTEMINCGLGNSKAMLYGKWGWEESRFRDLLERVRAETKESELRTMLKAVFVTASKPEA